MLHILPAMRVGGAEWMLTKLVETARGAGQPSAVLVLSSDIRAEFGERLKGDLRTIRDLPALRRQLGATDYPWVGLGWTYHGGAASILLRSLGIVDAAVLNVRRTGVQRSEMSRLSAMSLRGLTRLRGQLDGVIYCAAAAQAAHEAVGLAVERSVIIPNPMRLEISARQAIARRHRSVLLVGRHVRVKNFPSAIEALARSRDAWSEATIVGASVPALEGQVAAAGLLDRIRLLDEVETDALVELYASHDIYLQASTTEGFPNALSEAAALGAFPVATAVGATATICRGRGEVVETSDSAALERGLRRALDRTSAQRRAEAYAIAKHTPSPSEVLEQYAEFSRQVLHSTRRSSPT